MSKAVTIHWLPLKTHSHFTILQYIYEAVHDGQIDVCAKQGLGPTWTSAQSDQKLDCAING